MKDAAEVFDCPHCGKPTKIPQRLFGKKVRCPGCKEIFAAGGEPELDVLEEVKEDEAAPNPRRPKKRYRQDNVDDRSSQTRRILNKSEDKLEPRWKFEERRRLLISGTIAAVLGFATGIYSINSGRINFNSPYNASYTLGAIFSIGIMIAGFVSIIRSMLR